LIQDSNGDFYYPATASTSTHLVRHGGNASPNPDGDYGTITTGVANTDGSFFAEMGFNGVWYMTKGGYQNISSLNGFTFTANAKNTSFNAMDVSSGDYMIGIATGNNSVARGLLWDSASLLADQTLNFGKGLPFVIGYPSNLWSVVVAEGRSELLANGKPIMYVKYAQGETVETRYSIEAETSTNYEVWPTKGYYRNAMTWIGRIPTNAGGTTFREGIWAFGKGSDEGQMGVSVLLDTSSLGWIRTATWIGNSLYFCHNLDGSVSRLDNFNTGTYGVPATIETLIYGANSPYQKELQGITMVTENLPTGGSVQCYYRTDEDDPWTNMGTSDTVGKRKHTFTRAIGIPIGKFQEVQFKFVVTGKVTVKNIMVRLIETDDLAY